MTQQLAVPNNKTAEGALQSAAFYRHPRFARTAHTTQSVGYAWREQRPVAQEFNLHCAKWVNETRAFSSPVDIYLHPSYARIIGLGMPVVPLIFLQMKKAPNHWFYALRAITGNNPVSDDMAGDIVAMTNAWLHWGAERNLVSQDEQA